MKYKAEFEVTEENINNVLCSAFEGDMMANWASVRCKEGDKCKTEYYSDCITKGHTLIITDRENYDMEHELTLNKVLNAIGWYVSHEFWSKNYGTISEGVDSVGGDIIVQLAIFGEVIYG